MDPRVACLGFGEAARAFAGGWARRPARLAAFDIKTGRAESAAEMWAAYRALGVEGAATSAAALAGADCVLCLVTADQALAAAADAARHLAPGAFFFDMNSVAPETKRAASGLVEAGGGRYVDAAVMAPALPARAAVPLLLSGAQADAGAAMLAALGFGTIRTIGGGAGQAAAVKMIRSVMVKGIEALTAECVLAADAAGVLGEVLASLDASPPREAWAARADYNLDRMLTHGKRRAEEMREAAKTLEGFGIAPEMTRGTIARQLSLGQMGGVPPGGLEAKLALIRAGLGRRAA